MNSIKDISESILSHDELMLKELERRDGIYSFIFHELETSKSDMCDDSVERADAASKSDADLSVNMSTLPTTIDPVLTTAVVSAKSMHLGTDDMSDTTSFTCKPYHEFLCAWKPPAVLAFDHPKLYAYMANCGFRVRMATPPFSHHSAPLVRNRRHVLKEAPEYKQCEMCLFQVPDLRALFPHDPDVHAPFAKPAALHMQQQPQQFECETKTSTLTTVIDLTP